MISTPAPDKISDGPGGGAGRVATGPGLRARAAFLLVALFLVGLAPRLLGLGGAVTEDEDQWIDRSGTFARAFTNGEWRHTYLTGHPGVTVMWLTTLVLGPTRAAGLGEAARPPTGPGVPTLASGRVPVTTMPDFLPALHLGRLWFAALNAALAAFVGLLAWRLLGAGPGLLAGLLLALDPYWSGVGPIVGMDGPLTGFLGASLLSLLLACRERSVRRAFGWTALAGALWGVAFLTKTTALFVVPLVPTLLLAARLRARLARPAPHHDHCEGAARPTTRAEWGAAIRSAVMPAVPLTVAWATVGALTMTSLWPAAWDAPFATTWRAIDFSARLGGTPHGPGNFFLGQAVDDPGPLFYPVALALRLGPATTIGLLALLLFGAPRRMRFSMWSLLLFIVLFTLLLTVASKKVDRYLLPILPALDILAGVGWWEAARRLVKRALPFDTDIAGSTNNPVIPSVPSGQALSAARDLRTDQPAAPLPSVQRSFAALRMTILGLLRNDIPHAHRQAKAHGRAANPGRIEMPVTDLTGLTGGRPGHVGAANVPPTRTRHALLVAVGIGVAVLQAWPLLSVGHYPLAAYNPLFGGARAAELAIPVGWGDGLDVAADRIRELGDGVPLTTAIWFPLWVNFQAHAPGPVLTERRLADADVYVDYVHARQRGLTPRQLIGRRPDAVVRIADVDYARVYRLR